MYYTMPRTMLAIRRVSHATDRLGIRTHGPSPREKGALNVSTNKQSRRKGISGAVLLRNIGTRTYFEPA